MPDLVNALPNDEFRKADGTPSDVTAAQSQDEYPTTPTIGDSEVPNAPDGDSLRPQARRPGRPRKEPAPPKAAKTPKADVPDPDEFGEPKAPGKPKWVGATERQNKTANKLEAMLKGQTPPDEEPGDTPEHVKKSVRPKAADEPESDEDEEGPVVAAPKKAKKEPHAEQPDGDEAFENELITRATRLGLTDADLDGFDTLGEFDRHLTLLERHIGKARSTTNQPPREAQPAKPAVAQAPPVPKPQARPEPPPKPDAAQPPAPPAVFDRKALEDIGIDDTLLTQLDALNGHYAQEVGSIKGTIEQFARNVSAAISQMQVASMFDQFIGGLGEDYREVFGRGPTAALRPDSTHGKNRQTLLEEVNMLARAHADAAASGDAPSAFELMRRALWSVCPEQVRKSDQRVVLRRLHKRKQQFTLPANGTRHRLNGKSGSQEDRRARALDRLRIGLRNAGEGD